MIAVVVVLDETDAEPVSAVDPEQLAGRPRLAVADQRRFEIGIDGKQLGADETAIEPVARVHEIGGSVLPSWGRLAECRLVAIESGIAQEDGRAGILGIQFEAGKSQLQIGAVGKQAGLFAEGESRPA